MNWQPIETAQKDNEQAILLTCIIGGTQFWTAQAAWGIALHGYIQCASYYGWFPELPCLCDPVKSLKKCTSPLILGNVISEETYPPTHWMPLPEPPSEGR